MDTHLSYLPEGLGVQTGSQLTMLPATALSSLPFSLQVQHP